MSAAESNAARGLEGGGTIEFVPGGTPYLWIGDASGRYFGSISLRDLLSLLKEAGEDVRV